MDIRKPRRLQRGDCIGLITPASAVADAVRIEQGTKYLESLGYRVVVGEHVNKLRGYLAGTDDERAADINAMFANPDVSAIFCLRGGYGTPRLLPLINYRMIARNPKIFVGYSDITALQLALWRKCGLVTFQGPMAAVDFAGEVDAFAQEWFWKIVTSPTAIGRLDTEKGPTITLRPGVARGRLLGGNFALLNALLGTRYQPDFTGAILFLEDTDEEPYRIDRMFTHLRHASVLEKCKALLLGQFTNSEAADPTLPSLTLGEVLEDAASWTTVPVLSNIPFGHIPRKLTMPVGVHVRVDAGARIVEILEGAVR